MKDKIYSCLLLLINLFAFSSAGSGQASPSSSPDDLPNPFLVSRKYIKQNNYLTPIFELRAREDEYLASPRWKTVYLEMMTLLHGYVGDYNEAYRYETVFLQGTPSYRRVREMYAEDIAVSPVADYQMLDALDAIEAVAGKHRVIMINEEHRTPFHRAVTLDLLARLYRQGFRYFAAETVSETDSDLQKRGYPTQNTGYYTADPVYADAIRMALRLGYKIVPYESTDTNCETPADNPEFCNDRRERGQAQNLYERIFKTDPQAKIFVHVGRGHNSKAASSEKFNFMAYYFKNLTKIEPFTIDQLRFSERGETALEHPLYRFLTKNAALRKPSVFQSPTGGFYNSGLGYDMVIFHPRLAYKNGRAAFLEMDGRRKPTKINLKRLKLESRNQIFNGRKPVLVQAFNAQECADAVPIDQIILYPGKTIPVLMLPEGEVRIRTIDKAGMIVGEYRR